jgi:hypothetical protein
MGWTLLIALFFLAVILVLTVPDFDMRIKKLFSRAQIQKEPKLLDRYKILKRENK